MEFGVDTRVVVVVSKLKGSLCLGKRNFFTQKCIIYLGCKIVGWPETRGPQSSFVEGRVSSREQRLGCFGIQAIDPLHVMHHNRCT